MIMCIVYSVCTQSREQCENITLELPWAGLEPATTSTYVIVHVYIMISMDYM